MTPEEKKAFEEAFAMFETPAWKIFTADIQQRHDQLKNDLVNRSKEDFDLYKGYITGLATALSYEEMVKSEYKNRQEPDEDADL